MRITEIEVSTNGETSTYQTDEDSLSWEDATEFIRDNKPFSFYDNVQRCFTFINPKLCGIITVNDFEEDQR